jgi:hypothetical protein
MALARTRRHVLAACGLYTTVAFGIVACGTPAATDPATGPVPAASVGDTTALPAAAARHRVLDFGGEHRFVNGVAIAVSVPKSFQPGAGAYPQSVRAAAFEVAVRNDGERPYRLSGLSISATVTGTPAKQVVDSTQGFNGIVDAGKDIPPGRTIRLNLAFAVPDRPAELFLVLRPDGAGEDAATYCGPA